MLPADQNPTPNSGIKDASFEPIPAHHGESSENPHKFSYQTCKAEIHRNYKPYENRNTKYAIKKVYLELNPEFRSETRENLRSLLTVHNLLDPVLDPLAEIEKDYFELYRVSAANGNADALFALGYIYALAAAKETKACLNAKNLLGNAKPRTLAETLYAEEIEENPFKKEKLHTMSAALYLLAAYQGHIKATAHLAVYFSRRCRCST